MSDIQVFLNHYQREPDNTVAERDVSVCLIRLGQALQGAGKNSDALERYEAAYAIHEVLVERAPEYRPELGHLRALIDQVRR